MPAEWRQGNVDFSRFLTVACSFCGADQGQPCVTVSAKRRPRRPGVRIRPAGQPAGWPHLARRSILREVP